MKMDVERFRDLLHTQETLTQEYVICADKLYRKIREDKDVELRDVICKEIYNHLDGEHVELAVYLYSMLLNLNYDPKIMQEFLVYVREQEDLDYKSKYFLLYQSKSLSFLHSGSDGKAETAVTFWKLLQRIYIELKREIRTPLLRIPKEQRNPNLAVVITSQFLAVDHGPTKTALDRCAVMKKMGKEVLLMNTAEFMPLVGALPFVNAKMGSYNAALCEVEFQVWQGVTIPYFQCENVTPDAEVYDLLLDTIQKIKPAYVIEIGGNSLFTGLVNEMIPVITVGTTQSGLVSTMASYQTMHGKLSDDELFVLKNVGKTEEHILKGLFTFSLREQTETTTRKQEGLPENSFLLAVVGARLDEEVSDEFLDMLNGVLSEQIGVVFIGKFETYEKRMGAYPEMKPYTHHLGFCQDILSKLEICDLYINPTRHGGGTSVVEAMSKGKPAVSVNFGDVAGIIGDEFCCSDYKEMAEIIRRYTEDQEFYQEMSRKAEQLAAVYLDSSSEFAKIIKEYDRRETV